MGIGKGLGAPKVRLSRKAFVSGSTRGFVLFAAGSAAAGVQRGACSFLQHRGLASQPQASLFKRECAGTHHPCLPQPSRGEGRGHIT